MLEGNLSFFGISSENNIVTTRVVLVLSIGGHVSVSVNLNLLGDHFEVAAVVLVKSPHRVSSNV